MREKTSHNQTFWINGINLGIKKVFALYGSCALLLFFNQTSGITAATFLTFSLLYCAAVFGISVRKYVFFEHGQKHQVIDLLFPLHPAKNTRTLTVNESFASKIYLSPSRTWAYLDKIRIVLEKNSVVPQTALILGGGGCTVPLMLQHSYKMREISVVENSERMIACAKKYFIRYNNMLKLLHLDARTHLSETTKKYDFILVDVFKGEKLDNLISDDNFLDALLLRVHIKGLVVVNFGPAKHLRKTTSLLKKYQGDTMFFTIDTGNVLLFASKKDLQEP
jgi:hypothetical protein